MSRKRVRNSWKTRFGEGICWASSSPLYSKTLESAASILPLATFCPCSFASSSMVTCVPSSVRFLNQPKWSAMRCLGTPCKKWIRVQLAREVQETHRFLQLSHVTMTMPRSYERFEKTCACLCPQSGTVHVKAMAILGSCSIPGSLDEFVCAVGVDDEPAAGRQGRCGAGLVVG